MISKLALQPLHDAIERVLDVRRLRVRPERLARGRERGLEAPVTLGPMPLRDHLDLHSLDVSLQPAEALQLVRRELAEPSVDGDATRLQDEVHVTPTDGAARGGSGHRRDGRLPSG